jgi:hypothetical protein
MRRLLMPEDRPRTFLKHAVACSIVFNIISCPSRESLQLNATCRSCTPSYVRWSGICFRDCAANEDIVSTVTLPGPFTAGVSEFWLIRHTHANSGHPFTKTLPYIDW